MGSVKFVYLYRDGSNFKKWGEVVFANPDGLEVEKIRKTFNAALYPDRLFIADQISIPEVFLYAPGHIDADDHCFHEFAEIEESPDSPNDKLKRTIRNFAEEVVSQSSRGWAAFDPAERSLETSRSPRIKKQTFEPPTTLDPRRR